MDAVGMARRLQLINGSTAGTVKALGAEVDFLLKTCTQQFGFSV
jgi:hypothetical protein